MQEKYKIITEKICKKNGAKEDTIFTIFCDLESRYSEVTANDWLRGVLLDMDTAKAVFGKKDTHGENGFTMPYSCDGDCYGGCHFSGEEYKYHLQQLVLLSSNREILKYYERYL